MLSLIVAASENNVIGSAGTLPWHLPADLAHFKRTTMGHAIIMGRKNHEDISRALPGRLNIVITRQSDYVASGCKIAHSLDDALDLVGNDDEPFIIGGAQLYAAALPRVDRIYLTRVHATIEGDTLMPPIADEQWIEVSCARHDADAENGYGYSFIVLERK